MASLTCNEQGALRLFRQAYQDTGIDVCVLAAGGADLWECQTSGFLFWSWTYMVNTVSNPRLLPASEVARQGGLRLKAQDLESLVCSFLVYLKRESGDRWGSLPVALVADEFRTWLVGGPRLKPGRVPLCAREWADGQLRDDLISRIRLARHLHDSCLHVQLPVAGFDHNRFKNLMWHLESQLREILDFADKHQRQHTFTERMQRLARKLKEVVSKGLHFSYHVFQPRQTDGGFAPSAFLQSPEEQGFRRTVFGRLLTEFLNDACVREALDLPHLQVAKPYFPVLESSFQALEMRIPHAPHTPDTPHMPLLDSSCSAAGAPSSVVSAEDVLVLSASPSAGPHAPLGREAGHCQHLRLCVEDGGLADTKVCGLGSEQMHKVALHIGRLLTALSAMSRCCCFFSRQADMFTGFGRLFLTDASVKGMFDNFLDLLRSSSKSASAELAALTAAAELAYNKVTVNASRPPRGHQSTWVQNYQFAQAHLQAGAAALLKVNNLEQEVRQELEGLSYLEVVQEMQNTAHFVQALWNQSLKDFHGWRDFQPQIVGAPAQAALRPGLVEDPPAARNIMTIEDFIHESRPLAQRAYSQLADSTRESNPNLEPKFDRRKINIAVVGQLKACKTSLLNMLLMSEQPGARLRQPFNLLPVGNNSKTHSLWRISANDRNVISASVRNKAGQNLRSGAEPPLDLDALRNMLPDLQKLASKHGTCTIVIKLPKLSTFLDTDGASHTWERPAILDYADLWDTPGLGDTTSGLDCDAAVARLLENEACVFLWCMPYSQGAPSTACCDLIFSLAERAPGCILPVVTKVSEAEKTVAEGSWQLPPSSCELLQSYAIQASEAKHALDLAEAANQSAAADRAREDQVPKSSIDQLYDSVRPLVNVNKPYDQHVHLDNKRRNLEGALQHYHYAMDIDDLCSKIRLMVPNSVVAFAGLGPCARATEQDQNLLKALTNVLKSEFKQNSEAYQTLAELARLESAVASALAKIYNVVMPHALLDQATAIKHVIDDACAEYERERTRIFEDLEAGLVGVIQQAHSQVIAEQGFKEFLEGRPAYLQKLLDASMVKLRHYADREVTLQNNLLGQVAAETCRWLRQHFPGQHGCLGKNVEVTVSKEELELLVSSLGTTRNYDDLELKMDLVLGGQKLPEYSILRLYQTPGEDARILHGRNHLEQLAQLWNWSTHPEMRLHIDTWMAQDVGNIVTKPGLDDFTMVGHPVALMGGLTGSTLTIGRWIMMLQGVELTNPAGWLIFFGVSVAAMTAHMTWTHDEAQQHLASQLHRQVVEAKSDTAASTRMLKSTMHGRCGQVVRGFLSRLVGDPQAQRSLDARESQMAGELQRYREQVHQLLEDQVAELMLERSRSKIQSRSYCSKRALGPGSSRAREVSEIPDAPVMLIRSSDGRLEVANAGSCRERMNLDPLDLPPVKCWCLDFLRHA